MPILTNHFLHPDILHIILVSSFFKLFLQLKDGGVHFSEFEGYTKPCITGVAAVDVGFGIIGRVVIGAVSSCVQYVAHG